MPKLLREMNLQDHIILVAAICPVVRAAIGDDQIAEKRPLTSISMVCCI